MLNIIDKSQQTTHGMFDPRLNGQSLLHQFERLLNAVDFVSFDLFDTLIHREDLFSPKDLFYRVEEEAERQLGLGLNDFATVRVRAEEIARVRAWGRGIQEVTLDEIYAELRRLLNLETGMAQNLKEIELNCERSALTALESGQRLFEAALVAGKTIVIVSDTYFDEAFIAEIVRQYGYSGVQKVYASSAYGKTKVEGSLYDIVLKDLQCPPGRLLHIGDNRLSDVTVALSKNIRSFFVPTSKHPLKWRNGLGDKASGNLVMSAMLCDLSQNSRPVGGRPDPQAVIAQTATENLSCLYFGFAAWLVEQLKNQGYQRVYFAARDGLIMKRFFDLTAAAVGLEINSRYLYISRAAFYPSLIFTDPKMARRLFSHKWDHLTIEYALGRISLTFEECIDLLAKHQLANRKLQLDSFTMARFSAFLDNIWSLLEHKHEEHYRLIGEYLSQELVLTEEKAAFVDIGWNGTSQYCLLKLLKHLGIAKDLRGYYLGTFRQPVEAMPDFKATGYLVNNDEPGRISNLLRSGPSVLELFHSAGHGGVLRYYRDDASISPVLEDNPEERRQFLQVIEPMQNHAFNFVAKQLERLPRSAIKAPDPELVARTGLRVLYAPTATEATTFGSLKIASDFGGHMKSITGVAEWDLKKIRGDILPDGTLPMWRPGFQVLKSL